MFFQYRYSRNCGGFAPYCINVASSGYPSIPEYSASNPSASLTFWMFRAYTASATHAAPSLAVLIQPVVLYLQDKCTPNICDVDGCSEEYLFQVYLTYNFFSNIAYNYHVNQSSTLEPFEQYNAYVPVSSNVYYLNIYSSTQDETEPYWEVDFGYPKWLYLFYTDWKEFDASQNNTYIIFSNTSLTSPYFNETIAQVGPENYFSYSLDNFYYYNDGYFIIYAPLMVTRYIRLQKAPIPDGQLQSIKIRWCATQVDCHSAIY